jgi:hypothetical protein
LSQVSAGPAETSQAWFLQLLIWWPSGVGLLHELVPKAAVIAVLLDPNQLDAEVELREAEAAGRALGQQVLIVKVTSDSEFKSAFATIMQAGAGALLVGGSPVFINQRRQLVALTVRHALPASFPTRDYPEVGGRMTNECARQAGAIQPVEVRSRLVR